MSNKGRGPSDAGDVLKIDDVIHQRCRLGIMTTLASHPTGILFTELRNLTNLTDGNLNRHLKVLEQAGFLEVDKANSGRNSKSSYRLSKVGLNQFVQYLENLDSVLQKAQNAAQLNENRFAGDNPPGFNLI